MDTIRLCKHTVLVVILALAAACGGGGGGTPSSTPALTEASPTPVTPTAASVTAVSVNPDTPSAGVQVTFSVNGTNLQPGYTFALPGCVAKESDSTSNTQRQFACTLTQPGINLPGSVISPEGIVLFTFTQTVKGNGPLQDQRLSANQQHTCALTAADGVKCWGSNSSGQLGDGTQVTRLTPANVVGLGNGVIAVSTGIFQTCALTSVGSVKCWGFNGHGQLGDGTTQDRLTPTDVVGLGNGIISISVGRFHTCALTNTNGVKCWGANGQGQLGDGTTLGTSQQQHMPVDVAGLSGVVALSAGDFHTCAVIRTGGVKCWGDNSAGQLGDGTTQRRLRPFDVIALNGAVMTVSTGVSRTCAVTTAGAAKCWGDNRAGPLGDGTQVNRLTPVDVTGLNNGILQVAAGFDNTCALSTSGGVKCWGQNLNGVLGDGTTQNRLTPTDVTGLSNGAVAVSTGSAHSCALTSAPGLKCWGAISLLGIGVGTTAMQPTPVDVAGL